MPILGLSWHYGERPSHPSFFSEGDQIADQKKQIALLLSSLPMIQEALEQGSIVVFEQTRLRIHTLPINE